MFAALAEYSSAITILNDYKDAVIAYGELLSITYTPKAEWGTIILPINWANPEGWGRYTCAETEGSLRPVVLFRATGRCFYVRHHDALGGGEMSRPRR